MQDQPSLGAAAQNIGVVCQREGEAARERGDEPSARQHFEAARRSVAESLQVWHAQQNKPFEAASLSQLAIIHLRLGVLDAAECHAHAAREIRESLGLKEAWKDYYTLAEIAAARCDTRAAAEWTAKRDALLEELERRAGGGGGVPAQMLRTLQQLAIACAQAGCDRTDLGPAEEEALATLANYPAPFPEFASHLRQLATGHVPPLPANLPTEFRQFLEQLHQSIREATS